MDPPTSRELELEASLRQRDVQVAELSDEINRLRQYLVTQPGPSTTDLITLPPAFVSILLPHLQDISSRSSHTSSSSSTVTAALTQKIKSLQEENEELYQALRYSETGKLVEEVRVLRTSVVRLEKALQESHQIVSALSQELDKSREAFVSLRSNMHIEANLHHINSGTQSHAAGNGNGRNFTKPPPTGPKGHKRPRLSDAQQFPAAYRGNSSAPPQRPYRKNESRGRSPRSHIEPRGKHRSTSRMDVDGDSRARPRSSMGQSRDYDRDERGTRERSHRDKDEERDGDEDKDRERERGRERERERPKVPKRNGNLSGNRPSGGGAAQSSRKNDRNAHRHSHGGDRTLKERMGL